MTEQNHGTRRKLLAAAVDEFVEKGFAGARVDTVAREAQVNKRMIYHYFGSKQGIWEAIVEGEYWSNLTSEQKVRMQLWKMLASDRTAIEDRHGLQVRAAELAELQSRGIIRNDVNPLYVAAIERLVQQASSLWIADIEALSNPVDQLTELLTRLLRPRIRIKPRVVSV